MTEVPTPAELAAWCAVGSVTSAVGRSHLEVRGGSFGWTTFGPPPALVDVPDGADIAFWHVRPGRWRLEVDGERADHTKPFGWANGFAITEGGDATLRYDTPPLRYLVLALQTLVWIWALRTVLRLRLNPPVSGEAAP